MSPEALEMIRPYLDAANVDLKAYSEDFYRSYCGARLEGVKRTLKLMRTRGIFIGKDVYAVTPHAVNAAAVDNLGGEVWRVELGD